MESKGNELIREIAMREFAHDNAQRKLFVSFMEKRFPNEAHEPYIMEWVGRFKSGSPESYMDLQSQSVYMACQ